MIGVKNILKFALFPGEEGLKNSLQWGDCCLGLFDFETGLGQNSIMFLLSNWNTSFSPRCRHCEGFGWLWSGSCVDQDFDVVEW